MRAFYYESQPKQIQKQTFKGDVGAERNDERGLLGSRPDTGPLQGQQVTNVGQDLQLTSMAGLS